MYRKVYICMYVMFYVCILFTFSPVLFGSLLVDIHISMDQNYYIDNHAKCEMILVILLML